MTIVGHCPHCGAPIYAPSMWFGVTPPPSTHTCACVPQPQTRTGTTIEIEWPRPYVGSTTDGTKS